MKSILIVEDDEDLLETLQIFLEEELYDVKTLKSSAGFLKKFNKYNPDVVLMDVKLPGENGDILAKSIENHPYRRKTRIVLMSAWDDLSKRAEDARADAFIKKPFTLDDLLSII